MDTEPGPEATSPFWTSAHLVVEEARRAPDFQGCFIEVRRNDIGKCFLILFFPLSCLHTGYPRRVIQ